MSDAELIFDNTLFRDYINSVFILRLKNSGAKLISQHMSKTTQSRSALHEGDERIFQG